MTDATYTGAPRRIEAARTQDLPLPKPQPFGAPVLIYDCATPLAGETLLSLLMRRLSKDVDASDQTS